MNFPAPRGSFSFALGASLLVAGATATPAATPKTLMVLVDWWTGWEHLDTILEPKVSIPAVDIKRVDGTAHIPLAPTTAYSSERFSWWHVLPNYHPDQYLFGRIRFSTTYKRVWFQNDSAIYAGADDTLFFPDTQTTFRYQNLRTGATIVDTLDAVLPKRFVFPDTAKYFGPKAYLAAQTSLTDLLNLREFDPIADSTKQGAIDSCLALHPSDTLWLWWRIGNSPSGSLPAQKDMKCSDHNPYMEPHGSVAIFSPWTGAQPYVVVNGRESPLRPGPAPGWFQGEIWTDPKDTFPAAVSFRFLRSNGDVERIDSSGAPYHFSWKSKLRFIQPTLGTLSGYDSSSRRPPVVFAWSSPWKSRIAQLTFGGTERIQGQWSPTGLFTATVWGRPREASLASSEGDSSTIPMTVPPADLAKAADTIWLTSKSASGFVGRMEGTAYDYRTGNPLAPDTSLFAPRDTNAYFPFSQTTNSYLLEGLVQKRLSSTGRMRPSGQAICGMSQPYVEETLLDKVSCGEAANSPDKWFAPVSRGTKAMNTSIPFAIDLAHSTKTAYGFADSAFFPLDTLAKLPGTNEKNPFLDAIKDNRLALHNFGFCVELHGQAQPTPGAILTVKADDDTWVFVDSQLVVDLGGQHSAEQRSFALDRLPLPLPPVVSIDLFHCERHVNESILSISANFPIHPVGTLKTPSRISSIRPAPHGTPGLSLRHRANALAIEAAPGRVWSLELRGLDGRLQRSIAGTGAALVPWTNSGISVALLRSGTETIRGRFVSAR